MVQQKLVSSEKTKKDDKVNHDDSNSPKIRFLEFHEPWREVKLKDIASFSKGKGISKNEISEDGIPCIRYGELYTKYDENIIEIYSKTNLERKNLVFSEKNDILIPCSGETAIDLATASCVRDENVAIGGDITVIKTNQYAPFITYCLNNKRKEIAKYAQGVSIVHLYAKDFQELKFKIPQISEQKKIVNFLENLNIYVDSLEKTLILYRQHKIAITKNLFEDFIQKDNFIKLNEICSVNKGKQLNKSNMIKNGEYYVLNGGKEPSGYTDSWNVEGNTITISEGGNSCGFVFFNKEKFYCGGHCYYLTLKQQNFDLSYLYHYLKYIEPKIMKLRVGSGLPNIQKGDIENINVLNINYSKQKEIGVFLDLIDKKSELKLKEKEDLEIFKKALLQKMFV